MVVYNTTEKTQHTTYNLLSRGCKVTQKKNSTLLYTRDVKTTMYSFMIIAHST